MARSRSGAPTRKRATPRPRKGGKLGEYRRKRDFSITPEPPPDPHATVEKAGERPSFMIHKHHASRLHYDLRLEMDGALASWAIPKGPSLDPSVKRLAVETEDHPLAYGGFEGRIPDGEYGAGDSLIWDRGTYDTIPPGQASEQRRRGSLHLELRGEKLAGRYHLVKTRSTEGGKSQWLFFKSRDEHADPARDLARERPESVASGRVATRGPERARVLREVHPPPERLLDRVFPPMLATLVKAPPPDEEAWQVELKYDGYRALAALSGGKVAMWTRNRLDLVSRFPEVARALAQIVVGEAVIDGEIVALDAKGRPRFQLLQRGAREVYYAFDLLWLDGEDLRERPLEERRDLLASLLGNSEEPIAIAERVDGKMSDMLERARRGGWEGLVAKRRGSRYLGKRSPDWIKLKVTRAQEAAVVGFTDSESPRGGIGALLVAVQDRDGLRYAGKVGTGYSDAQRRQLATALRQIEIDRAPCHDAPRLRAAHWVEPGLVAQVELGEWTADGKMRHPSFQGIRADKSPAECVREIPTEMKPKRRR